MNDIHIGDVFAHRTLTIKTPFTPVPFPATYEVQGLMKPLDVNDRFGMRITLRALHHYKPAILDLDGDLPVATLVTELPDEHGEQFTINPRTIEKWYVFLRHADGGI